ncbi:MAG: type IV pili methyl-accepting chemotaxis transducer N-terminal domain-containing protein [Pseudomonadota bacterium]
MAIDFSRLFFTAIIVSSLSIVDFGSASASDPAPNRDQQVDLSKRLVIAGRQRMLAEGMASKLCFAEAGVRREESLSELYLMWNIFNWYHSGILLGNVQLELKSETDPYVVAAWRTLDNEWWDLKSLYEPVLDGVAISPASFAKAQSSTEEVTQLSDNLVAALRSAYSKRLGQRGFGATLLIDLYERQRMLSHRIAKNTCLMSTGDKSPERRADLAEMMSVFDNSLAAFQNGMADFGIPKPPNEEIATALASVKEAWDGAKPLISRTAIGAVLNTQELTVLAETNDRIVVAMTAAINGLVLASETN